MSVFAGDLGRLVVFATFIPLLVRIVGEDGFGIYALGMAFFLLFRRLLNFGLFDATKNYVSQADSSDRSRVITASLWLHIALLLIGIPVVYAIISIFPTTNTLDLSLLFILLSIVGSQFFNFGRGVLHSFQLESLVEPLIPIRSLILASIGLSLAHFGNWGVPGVFAGFSVGFLFAGGIATVLAIQRCEFRPDFSWSALQDYGGPLLRFGFPSMLLLVFTIGLYKIDILLVSYFSTPAQTGYYRAALQVAEFIWVISIGMEKIMIQSTAELWKDNATTAITDLTSRMLKYVVILSVLVLVGVFVLSGEFLSLYFGPTYIQSVRPLRILLPGVLGFAIARSIWPVVQASGNIQVVVFSTIAAVIVNTVLNIILIPTFGIEGAAIATSFSYILMGVLHVKNAHRISIYPLMNFPTYRVAILGLITGGVLWFLKSVVPADLRLFILPPIGFIIYIYGTIVTGVMTWTDLTHVVPFRDG